MGVKLEKYKRENIDKIKIGSCLEFIFLHDTIRFNFERLKDLIESNSDFFEEQHKYIISKNLNDILSLLDNSFDLILCNIDSNEKFCEYHSQYY